MVLQRCGADLQDQVQLHLGADRGEPVPQIMVAGADRGVPAPWIMEYVILLVRDDWEQIVASCHYHGGNHGGVQLG